MVEKGDENFRASKLRGQNFSASKLRGEGEFQCTEPQTLGSHRESTENAQKNFTDAGVADDILYNISKFFMPLAQRDSCYFFEGCETAQIPLQLIILREGKNQEDHIWSKIKLL